MGPLGTLSRVPKQTSQLDTHISHGFADEGQLGGLVDGAPQLAGVAAVWRHRLGRCDGQTETRNAIIL